jgi:hypothetical protein
MYTPASMGSCYMVVDLSRLLVCTKRRLWNHNTNEDCFPSLPNSSFLTLNHVLHTNIPLCPPASDMTGHTCASDGCSNVSTRRYRSCKITWYCTKKCQKAHWKKHKLDCKEPDAFPPLRPGVFDFMKLPREVRDKVSSSFLVLAYSPLIPIDADLRRGHRCQDLSF